MGEAFGNPKELEFAFVITRFEMETCPSPKVARVAAEIDGDVPDVARENTHEFPLRVAELVMKAAKYTTCGERLIVLREGVRKTKRYKSVGVEDFSKPSPCVTVTLGLQNFYIAQ